MVGCNRHPKVADLHGSAVTPLAVASAFDAVLLVVRGGSWQDDEDDLRLASRAGFEPGLRHENVGFRLVSSAPVP